MPDSNSLQYTLTISIDHPNLNITIYNGYGDVIAVMVDDLIDSKNKSVQHFLIRDSHVSLKLNKGIYQIDGELGGQTESILVRLNNDTRVCAPKPKVYSAVPLAKAVTSKDYYADAAFQLSRATLSLEHKMPNLLFFIRTISAELAQDINIHLRILKENGDIVFNSEIHNVLKDDEKGWFGVSLSLDSGGYLVEINESTRQRRAIPIWLTSYFQTQIFGLFTNGKIDYNSLRLLMAPKHSGFNPEDPSLAATEIMTTSLLAGSRNLTGAAMREALSGKFENPIVGLFAAHNLLRRNNLDENLLDIVINNLSMMLENSPDVIALKVMQKTRMKTSIDDISLSFPPTLQASYLGIIEADSKSENVVEANSLLERIGICICTDTPFVTWDLSLNNASEKSMEWIKQRVVTSLSTFAMPQDELTSKIGEMSKSMGITQNLLKSAVLDVLSESGQQINDKSPFEFISLHFPKADDVRWKSLGVIDMNLSADKAYQVISKKLYSND